MNRYITSTVIVLLLSLGVAASTTATAQSNDDDEAAGPAVRVSEAVPTHDAPVARHAVLKKAGSSLQYPVKAQRFGLEGTVTVSYAVDEKGRVSDIQIVEALGHGCDDAVLRWLRTVRFNPAVDTSGNPIALRYATSVVFDLDGDF